MRLGFPSPRMRSPTLRAAASVKTRSVSAVTFMSNLDLTQLTLYLRSQAHFNDAVVDVPQHLGMRPQDEPLTSVDIALDGAIEGHIRHLHGPFDAAILAHRQGGARGVRGADVACDAAVEMQAAGEVEVTLQPG